MNTSLYANDSFITGPQPSIQILRLQQDNKNLHVVYFIVIDSTVKCQDSNFNAFNNNDSVMPFSFRLIILQTI